MIKASIRAITLVVFIFLLAIGLVSCGGSGGDSQDPTVSEVRNALVGNLGEDEGFVALFAAMARGYSLAQIVDAILSNSINSDGEVTDASGGVVAPSTTSDTTVTVVSDTGSSSSRIFLSRRVQVQIETQFIEIDQNFLDNLGVDFRGFDNIDNKSDVPLTLAEQGYTFLQIVGAVQWQQVGNNPNSNLITIFEDTDFQNILQPGNPKQNVIKLDIDPIITPDETIQLVIQPTIIEFEFDPQQNQLPVQVGQVEVINQGDQQIEVLVEKIPNGLFLEPPGPITLNPQQSNFFGVYLKDENQLPIIGDIPFVGRLFANQSETRVERNLMIFVTPRIITDIPE